jgi:hypothetical protein
MFAKLPGNLTGLFTLEERNVIALLPQRKELIQSKSKDVNSWNEILEKREMADSDKIRT